MNRFRLLMIGLIGLIMASCSSSEEAKRVNDRITDGETLTQEDYSVIIDYLGNFAEKAQPLQDAIDNLPADSEEAEAKTGELADLRLKYPYYDVFNRVLSRSTKAEVGEDNVAKTDAYAKYFWFTAPDWASVETDPEVAGLIEEMPSPDSTLSDEVVAQGDGVAVK